MILENACEYKDYLGSVFDAMGFNGSFEVVGNAIHLNINIVSDNEKPTKKQVLEKLKEIMFKTKKQELEAKINATNQINTNKTESLEAITQAKTTANNEISNNQTQAITTINEAKKPIIIKTLIFLRLNKAC
ncbi:hypothetical protein [Helicobacter pylori]|uniref:hypothetical protein n=1 Tax=Helicobacter pylori TaxID=210 RepID=UPI001FBBE272|nr:hypothetical protein [Helicobacter pylori]